MDENIVLTIQDRVLIRAKQYMEQTQDLVFLGQQGDFLVFENMNDGLVFVKVLFQDNKPGFPETKPDILRQEFESAIIAFVSDNLDDIDLINQPMFCHELSFCILSDDRAVIRLTKNAIMREDD